MRTVTALLGNSQRLDGGAMFGNAPKAMWEHWLAADEQNRIVLACRAMLVQDGLRTILFEAGIGCFFEPKLQERFGIMEREHVLLQSLAKAGLQPQDIDIVVLSHLHFDHAGGLLTPWRENKPHELVFPRAQFVVGKIAWQRALAPHYRDRASFVPELNTLLQDSGRLHIVEDTDASILGEGFDFYVSHGHTPGMLLSEVMMPSGPIVFAADLIPGTPWVHLPITMGYDRAAEQLIDEKAQLLESLVQRKGRLFYTHDEKVAVSNIAKDEKGRFVATCSQAQVVQLTD